MKVNFLFFHNVQCMHEKLATLHAHIFLNQMLLIRFIFRISWTKYKGSDWSAQPNLWWYMYHHHQNHQKDRKWDWKWDGKWDWKWDHFWRAISSSVFCPATSVGKWDRKRRKGPTSLHGNRPGCGGVQDNYWCQIWKCQPHSKLWLPSSNRWQIV